MSLAPAIQGARKRFQTITFTDDGGTAIDLSGATLRAVKQAADGTISNVTGDLVLVTAASGIFKWTYSVADVADAGMFRVQFTATYASDGLREKSYMTPWRVYESFAFESASLSPSASPSPSA